MASTYTPIASYTLTSNLGSGIAVSLSLANIPSTYTDLVLVINGPWNGTNAYMQFNGDTGTNYSVTTLNSDGGTNTSSRVSTSATPAITVSTAQSRLYLHINIMDYSRSSKNRTSLIKSLDVNNTSLRVHTWRNTAAAINSIQIYSSNTLLSGLTFNLYGIKAG
jgi:hypothetical protein